MVARLMNCRCTGFVFSLVNQEWFHRLGEMRFGNHRQLRCLVPAVSRITTRRLVGGEQLLSDPQGTVPPLNDPNMIANGKCSILFLDNNDDITIIQLDFNFPGRPGRS